MSTEKPRRVVFGTPGRKSEKGRYVEMYRTPTDGSTGFLILTSPKYDLVPTHFIDGRTKPHFEEDCEGCDRNLGIRDKVYMSAVTKKDSEIVVFECPGGVESRLLDYLDLHSTLRGCSVRCFRDGNRENGRVRLLMQPSGIPDSKLPLPVSIRPYLARVWEIDPTWIVQAEDSQPEPGALVRSIAERLSLNNSNGNHHNPTGG